MIIHAYSCCSNLFLHNIIGVSQVAADDTDMFFHVFPIGAVFRSCHFLSSETSAPPRAGTTGIPKHRLKNKHTNFSPFQSNCVHYWECSPKNIKKPETMMFPVSVLLTFVTHIFFRQRAKPLRIRPCSQRLNAPRRRFPASQRWGIYPAWLCQNSY